MSEFIRRIAIVEDESIVALDVKIALEHDAYESAGIFPSGEKLLGYLEDDHQPKPDLIIMDVQLAGELDGLQTAEIVATEYRIPIVILTAFRDPFTLARVMQAAPYGYLTKPFNTVELRTTVTIALLRFSVEQQERQSQQIIRNALESLPDGILVLDNHDIVVEVNTPLLHMFSISYEQVISRTRESFLDQFCIDPTIQPCYVEGGVQKWLEIIPGYIDASRTTAIVIFRDVTQRVEAEKELAAIQLRRHHNAKMEALGRMSAGIAHDFNNLLAIITGHIAVLKQQFADQLSPTAAAGADGILAATQHGSSLINQLLTFSRHQPTAPESINTGTYLLELKDIMDRLLAGAYTISIQVETPDVYIYADSSQIKQAIINLVLNAKDAMSSGGTIRLASKSVQYSHARHTIVDKIPAGDYLEISVQDYGTGIAEDVLQNVFEPFFSTKQDDSSYGLGLSIVFGIVKQNHGYIDIETTDIGTTFRLYFPRS